MHRPAEQTFSGSRRALRAITLSNFFIFVLFVVPPTHRWVDRGFLALRSIHFEGPVGLSLQIWLLVSTLGATALLIRMVWEKRRTVTAGMPSASLGLEATLVAVWWAVVLAACVYGFTLGMGG